MIHYTPVHAPPRSCTRVRCGHHIGIGPAQSVHESKLVATLKLCVRSHTTTNKCAGNSTERCRTETRYQNTTPQVAGIQNAMDEDVILTREDVRRGGNESRMILC